MKRTKILVVSTIMMMMLTGCEQYSASEAPETIVSESPHATSEPIASASPVLSPTNTPAASPMKEPDGFETGVPKEGEVVSEPKKEVKKSDLKPIYSVGKGKVAITIDDGPTKYTAELLKVLREQNALVTFFFLGQNVGSFPRSVTEAVYDGHEVGYHSDTHPQMTQMTYDAQKIEFNSGLSKLEKLDKLPVTLFRPPYGAYNNDTKLITEEHNMKMVLWNEDPKDWATTDPSQVVKNVLAQVESGSIIVMHDHPSTIAALPGIIKGIRSKGYTLVTVTR